MARKAIPAVHNQLLRRARQERGWTQQVVADRIGAPNDVIITRWERGAAFPSAYYVERLCQLFEQKASDLGLIREVHTTVASHHLVRSQSLSNSLGNPTISSSQQNIPLFSSLSLVGREANMRTLEALYWKAQQGQMQVALIQGEAGIGKTHLASAFLHWAAAQGAELLQGRAFEMGGRLPYQPLAHALSRRLEAEPALEALLSAIWLSELSRILPELHDRYHSLPLMMGDEMTARLRLFEAVTRLGQAFCERSPVVLFIDDVQWADGASLDMLHYAGQRWSESGTPLLLLLSMRSEALATMTPLNRWLASLHHDLLVTELTPGPLTQDEMQRLLATLGTGHALAVEQRERFTDLGQWLFCETHGQPFYLIETLKMLVERQVLMWHHSSEEDVLELDLAALEAVRQQSVLVPNVRRLILSQLNRLTTMGYALVRSSAILGQETLFEVLYRVADLTEEEALVALSEILGYGLLREASKEYNKGAYYIFGHDKVREVIVTEMGEAQRCILHRRAFAVLEALTRPAAELAHHARAGGLTEQDAHFSLAAGNEAIRLFAYVEAHLHYTQALEAIAQLPDTGGAQRLRVETILKLVRVSWMTVDVEQTLKLLAEAEKLAHALLDQRQLAHIHYWMGVVYGTCNAMRQARAYAAQVLVEAQELGDEDLVALASVQLSRVLTLQGYFGPIKELLTPIIPVLGQTAGRMDKVYALGYLGISLAARGHTAAGVAQGQRAVEHARHSGELKNYSEIMARHFLRIIHLFGGNYFQIVAENDQIVEDAQQQQNWLLVYWECVFGGWAKVRLEKYKEAMQSLERAQDASRKLGRQIMGQDIFAAVSAELRLSTGQVEEALAQAQATIELARAEVGGMLSEGIAQRVWGQALVRLACWEEAKTHLNASVQTLLSGENLMEVARTQVIWGLLCRDHGEREEAIAHFRQAAAQFESSGLTRELETIHSYLIPLL